MIFKRKKGNKQHKKNKYSFSVPKPKEKKKIVRKQKISISSFLPSFRRIGNVAKPKIRVSISTRISKPKKTKLNKQIKSTLNYYRRQFKPLVSRFMSSQNASSVEKKQITRLISDSLEIINLTLKANRETEDFRDEVRASLKDALKFLKDLESVGWSTGRYLNVFGFHHLFLPEDVWYAMSSIKLEEALERTNAYIQEVLDYAKGNRKSALENQENKIRSRRDNDK